MDHIAKCPTCGTGFDIRVGTDGYGTFVAECQKLGTSAGMAEAVVTGLMPYADSVADFANMVMAYRAVRDLDRMISAYTD